MMRKALARALVLSCTLGLSTAVMADDTDLFLVPKATSRAKPNVLFVIDNSANWNATLYKEGDITYTKKKVEHAALKAVLVDSTKFVGGLNVGFMTFAKGNSPEGGKIIKRVQPLTSTSTTLPTGEVVPSYQQVLGQMLYTVDGKENLEGTNNAPYASMLNEAYLYYSGLTPKSGLQDPYYDTTAVSGGTYISPVTDGCVKNIIIFLGNGGPDSGENNYAEKLLAALGGKLSTDPMQLTPNNYAANWGDEFARFMSGIDTRASVAGTQNIITYVINVTDPSQDKTRSDLAASAYLENLGKKGLGGYLVASTTEELQKKIEEILEQLQAVDSVFAATTLPVSVNVRGTNLNQVYIGVFRPDGNKKVRWWGNLKLYQLGYSDTTKSVFLMDKNGIPAQDMKNGFIVPNAVSFWTHSSTYWSYLPVSAAEASDSPDGRIVEKGGAAQKLRDKHPNRNLYTCTGSCTSNSLLSGTPFADNATQAALGTADATATTTLIDWVKGYDTEDANANNSLTDVRPCIHGDVLHSRPAIINYNRNGDDDDIIAYYGGNDGIFHAVKGGKADTNGYEKWGFIPVEFFGKLKSLHDNPVIDADHPKPYFADGSIGVYQSEAKVDGKLVSADGDKVYLYLSMRRGGRLIYALDVSDPDNPKHLWKRDYNSTGYSELGQTWSEPKVAKVNVNGTAKTVLIFGAGYDPAVEDFVPTVDNPTPPARSMGRGVFIVDAFTGSVLWQAGPNDVPVGTNGVKVTDMTYSIPSDVTVLNRDGDADKYADRVYVGDTGGNVWRIDIGDINNDGVSDPAEWAVHKLASIGGTGADARKFLYPPDIVYGRDASGAYDAVLIGSGDREHPFDLTVSNRFYMFKDRMIGLSGADQTTFTEANLYDATDNYIQDGDETQKTEALAALAGSKGWYIRLGQGEKVVTSAVTLAGTTFFSTNQPAAVRPGTCANLGIARTYAVSYQDATATMEMNNITGITKDDRSVEVAGGGYPPSPVPVIVEIDGKKYEAVISGTNVLSPPGTKLEARRRVFWYKENID